MNIIYNLMSNNPTLFIRITNSVTHYVCYALAFLF